MQERGAGGELSLSGGSGAGQEQEQGEVGACQVAARRDGDILSRDAPPLVVIRYSVQLAKMLCDGSPKGPVAGEGTVPGCGGIAGSVCEFLEHAWRRRCARHALREVDERRVVRVRSRPIAGGPFGCARDGRSSARLDAGAELVCCCILHLALSWGEREVRG